MTADRAAQLRAEGFERIRTWSVGFAHHVWKVDLDVEFDRDLRLVEETVLRLIHAGIADPDRIAELMGLDDGRIVPSAIVELLRRGAVLHRDAGLVLAKSGETTLERAATRELRKYTDVELRFDPYRNELVWNLDEHEIKVPQLRASGTRGLPAPPNITPTALESRHQELQQLLERHGFPFDKAEGAKEREKRRREIVGVRAIKTYVAYREAELEAWFRPNDETWQWRLLRGGGEEQDVSQALADLERAGEEIIPLEERTEVRVSEAGEELDRAARDLRAAPTSVILQTEDHRAALKEAILEARSELIIISPWLRVAAVDQNLLGWLQTAIDRTKALHVVIGYGIANDKTVADQQEALRRLRRLADRYGKRFRIVHVGDTHEKIVVCDERFAIITSFNFLSFNPRPGRGVRREMGTRSTDPRLVADVKRRLKEVLDDP